MRTIRALVAVAFVVASTGSAHAEQASRAVQTARCMLDVLKAEPGVVAPKLIIRIADGWNQPCLEYRYHDEYGNFGTVGFCADKHGTAGDETYDFTIVLNGLSTPGKKLSDMGSTSLIPKWRTKCHAEVYTLFE